MRVEILRDAFVKFPKGAVVEVSEEEARRLIAFGNAKEAQQEKKTRKK